jgi:hypothetical protein
MSRPPGITLHLKLPSSKFETLTTFPQSILASKNLSLFATRSEQPSAVTTTFDAKQGPVLTAPMCTAPNMSSDFLAGHLRTETSSLQQPSHTPTRLRNALTPQLGWAVTHTELQQTNTPLQKQVSVIKLPETGCIWIRPLLDRRLEWIASSHAFLAIILEIRQHRSILNASNRVVRSLLSCGQINHPPCVSEYKRSRN